MLIINYSYNNNITLQIWVVVVYRQSVTRGQTVARLVPLGMMMVWMLPDVQLVDRVKLDHHPLNEPNLRCQWTRGRRESQNLRKRTSVRRLSIVRGHINITHCYNCYNFTCWLTNIVFPNGFDKNMLSLFQLSGLRATPKSWLIMNRKQRLWFGSS